MKQKDIEVRVMGKHELDWTACYLLSRHVHKAAALEKVCKLLQRGTDSRIEMFDFSVSSLPVLRVGPRTALPFCKTWRAWVYDGYWPTKILSKLRKFYPTIEGVDHE